MLQAVLIPEEAAGRSRRSAARSRGGGKGGRDPSPLLSAPWRGRAAPRRKELRAAVARGSVWSRRTLIGCKKVKLKPR